MLGRRRLSAPPPSYQAAKGRRGDRQYDFGDIEPQRPGRTTVWHRKERRRETDEEERKAGKSSVG